MPWSVTPHATRDVGDPLDGPRTGKRYGMDGDGYMTASEICAQVDVLAAKARSCVGGDALDWLPETAVRLRLAKPGVGLLEAGMILASAHVTWSDICHMKS